MADGRMSTYRYHVTRLYSSIDYIQHQFTSFVRDADLPRAINYSVLRKTRCGFLAPNLWYICGHA